MSQNKQEDIRRGIYRHMSPEEIDTMIKARITVLSPHTRPKGCHAKETHWTEAEEQVRNGVVLDYVGKGLSRRRVAEELCERWQISMRTALSYHDEAIRSLRSEEADEDLRKKYIERLERVAEYCEKTGNVKGMLQAQDQLNKIGAMYTERKEVEIAGDEIKFKFGN